MDADIQSIQPFPSGFMPLQTAAGKKVPESVPVMVKVKIPSHRRGHAYHRPGMVDDKLPRRKDSQMTKVLRCMQPLVLRQCRKDSSLQLFQGSGVFFQRVSNGDHAAKVLAAAQLVQ
jgi:hypothetical protein